MRGGHLWQKLGNYKITKNPCRIRVLGDPTMQGQILALQYLDASDKRNNFSQNPTKAQMDLNILNMHLHNATHSKLSDAAVPDIDSFNRQRSDSYQVSKHRLGNCRWLHNPHPHLHSTFGWRMKGIIAEGHEGRIHFHAELLTLQSSRCVSPHSL